MTNLQQTLDLLHQSGVVRPQDLKAQGIAPTSLYQLYRQGKVIRTSRGIYTLADTDFTEHHSLVEICKRVPHGCICLLSALHFHTLGTQNPFEVWLAIDRKARRPRVAYPPLRVLRFSGAALHEGIEEHQIEGVTVRVYSIAKTVADCFKYRNKIGLDVALEALRACRTERRCTHQELWHYAQINRVTHVMKPYLEAVG